MWKYFYFEIEDKNDFFDKPNANVMLKNPAPARAKMLRSFLNRCKFLRNRHEFLKASMHFQPLPRTTIAETIKKTKNSFDIENKQKNAEYFAKS